jgi:hypothetical protein
MKSQPTHKHHTHNTTEHNTTLNQGKECPLQATPAAHSKSSGLQVPCSNPEWGTHVRRPTPLSGGLPSTKRVQRNSYDPTGEYQDIRSGMLLRDGPLTGH